MAREIKTSIALDGEQKFKKAMESINRELRVLGSELKTVTSGFDKSEATMTDWQKVGEALNRQIEQQKGKISALEIAVSDSAKAYDSAVTELNKLSAGHDKNSDEVKFAAKAVDSAGKTYDGYRIQLNYAKTALNGMESALADNNKSLAKTNSYQSQVEASAAALNQKLGALDSELGLLGAELKSVTSGYDKSNASMKDLRQTSELLNKQIDQQKTKISTLGDAVKESSTIYSTAKKRLEEVKTQFAANSDEVKFAAKAVDSAGKSMDEYQTQLYDAKTALNGMESAAAENNRKMGQTAGIIPTVNTQIQKFKQAINNLPPDIKAVGVVAAATFKGIGIAAEASFKTVQKATEVGLKGFELYLKSLTTAITAATAVIGGFAIKTGMDFESAFAGVEKTVDGTEEQLQKLRDGIIGMSKELPSSAVEIAAVSEAAGQLGIQTDNVLGFTRTMIDLGESTTLSADEAASAFARFANITGMSQTDFDKLGSSIVQLGNNLATTETEITEMALRLAGAGAQVGMSESDILGLSAALSSVGIEAEMGGSAFSKTMVSMKVATETGLKQMQELEKKTGMTRRELELMASNDGKGFKDLASSLGMTTSEINKIVKSGKDLEGFANIAGMTAAQFSKAYSEDAVGALGAFINGLGAAESKGTTAIELLDELGISETRLRDSLLRAGNASELFSEAIDMSNSAWNENIALTNEAAKRYETTESKLEILKNTASGFGIAVYEGIQEPLREAIGAVTEYINRLTSAFEGSGIDGVISEFLVIVSEVLDEFGGTFVKKITENIPMILKSFNQLISSVAKALNDNLPTIVEDILPELLQGFTDLVTDLTALMPTLLPTLAQGAMTLFIGIINALNSVLALLLPMLPGIIQQISDMLVLNLPIIIQGGVTLLTGLITGISQSIPILIQAIVDMMPQIVATIMENLPLILQAGIDILLSVVNGIAQMLPELIPTVIELIYVIIGALIENLPMVIEAAMDIISAVIKGIVEALPLMAEQGPEIIASIVAALIESLPKIISAGLDIMTALGKGLLEYVHILLTAIPKLFTKIKEKFAEMDWLQLGKDMINGIVDGVTGFAGMLADKVKETAGNALDTVKSFLGIHSPSTVFRDQVGINLAAGIGVGFEKEMKNVTADIERAIPTNFDAAVNATAGSIQNVSNSTKNYTYGGLTVNLYGTTVRNDEDIYKIAYELNILRQREAAAVGG